MHKINDDPSIKTRLSSLLPEEQKGLVGVKQSVLQEVWQSARETSNLIHGNGSIDNNLSIHTERLADQRRAKN